MPVTLADIAERASVNVSTVSRILSGNADFPVSPAKRDQVLRLARQFNYVPKRAARSLVSGKTYTIAAVLGSLERDFAAPTFSLVLAEITRRLWAHSYAFTILPVDEGAAADDAVLRTLRGSHADGYFVPFTFLKPKTLNEIQRTGAAIVSLERPLSGESQDAVSHVRFAELPANQTLTRELVRLGHHRALCFGPEHIALRRQRFAPLHEAASQLDAGALELDSLVYTPADTGPLHDREEARIAARRHFDRIRRHTAVVCGSDLMALGLADVIREHGLVPGADISIVGHDNLEASPHFRSTKPWLATIDRRSGEVGRVIADLLLERVRQPTDKPTGREVTLTFISRPSLGPAPQSTDAPATSRQKTIT